jgi:hypothetical protein
MAKTRLVLGSRCVVLVDSIAEAGGSEDGCVVVSGSHGGASAGRYALGFSGALVVFNDAGVGKDEAGIAALPMLEAEGVAAVAVSHATARIGDARDTWDSGVISHANAPALRAGFARGQALRDSVERFLAGK